MNPPRSRTNRSFWRQRGDTLLRLSAGLCAGLVLILCVLAASPDAHHWLHHDSGAQDHECAVVAFAHGLTPAGEQLAVEAILLFLVAERLARYRRPDLLAPRYVLRPERGPPEKGSCPDS